MDKQDRHYIGKQYFKDKVLENMGGIFQNNHTVGGKEFSYHVDPLADLLEVVCANIKVNVNYPPNWHTIESLEEKIALFCDLSNCSFRHIVCNENTLKNDLGPVLFFDTSGSPFVITQKNGKSILIRYSTSHHQFCSIEEVLARVQFGIMLIPSLPNKVIDFKDVLRIAYEPYQYEVYRIVLFSFVAGLIASLFPLGIGVLFGTIIPAANKQLLYSLVAALLVVTISRELFRLTNNLLTSRLQGWISWNLQSAILHRLLKLPVSFQHDDNSAALASKVIGFKSVSVFLASGVSGIVFNLFFAFFNLVALYYFDTTMALIATLPILIYIVILYKLMAKELKSHLLISSKTIWLDSMVLQFIMGLNKVKQAAAEWQIIAYWSHHYTQLAKQLNSSSKDRIAYDLLIQNVPWVAQAFLFATFVYAGINTSTASFLGFNAAFFNFFLSMAAVAGFSKQLKEVIPAYNNIKPYLQGLPETIDPLKDGIDLHGDIALEGVNFKYEDDGPLILNDLSFRVEQGQSVALVGSSGSGKSTILRLLLGFETPLAGQVLYDGRNLSEINVKSLRKQLGVVLQSDSLMAGSILDNILGTKDVDEESAWLAAESAAIKTDIESMPMGMHTVISDHAATLSGGQKQRLLIARAIVGSPKVLFFDEATSALDNLAQKEVANSLNKLKATRIIVAHRLSTIKEVDQILYIENGTVVEKGTYDELMESNGRFKKLADRQLI